jgi:hypothetical protein
MLHESLIWHRESRLIVVVVAAVVDHNFALLGHVRAGGPDRTLRRRHVRGRLRNEAERAHGGPRTQQRRQRVGPMGEVALQGRMGVEWMVVAGQRRHFQLLQLGLLKPLRFGAPVLEPDLHLQRKGNFQKKWYFCFFFIFFFWLVLVLRVQKELKTINKRKEENSFREKIFATLFTSPRNQPLLHRC